MLQFINISVCLEGYDITHISESTVRLAVKNACPHLPYSLTWATLLRRLASHCSHLNCLLMFAVRLMEVWKIAEGGEDHWNLRHSPLLPQLAHKADGLKDGLIPSQSFFQCLARNEMTFLNRIRGSHIGGYECGLLKVN